MCDDHRRDRERQRGTSTKRGYGAEHNALRRRWAPKVATGTVACARCHTLIPAGTAWDLGHHDTDRTKWTGPEHQKCNRAVNANRGGGA